MEKKRILVVEDDPDVMETLQFRLNQEGYEVLTAVNGWEALGGIRVAEPDLLLLDVMLPKENGYRVSHMIKEDERQGRYPKKIPIIMLTARNLENDPDRQAMFNSFSQAEAVIYKPFDMQELIIQINNLLGRESGDLSGMEEQYGTKENSNR